MTLPSAILNTRCTTNSLTCTTLLFTGDNNNNNKKNNWACVMTSINSKRSHQVPLLPWPQL